MNRQKPLKGRVAAVFMAAVLGVTLFGLVSFAAGGTYYTYIDNANNTNIPASNSNTTPDNDMALGSLATEPAPSITFGNTSSEAPIEFNINVSSAPTSSASLTIRAYDVDEEPQTNGDHEQDDVYLNGHLLGRLSGANNVWSTTVFNISNLAWINTGNNLVQVQIDTAGDPPNWVTAIRWGQILVDGGAADKANTGAVVITGCLTRTGTTVVGCSTSGSVAVGNVQINTQATVNAVVAGNYRLEVTIIDPAGNATSVLTDNFTATANSTVVRTVSPTYALSGATGTYTVQSQLFYIDSNSFPVQQDIATASFQHTTNVGPTDLDNDGLTNAQEINLGTSPTNRDTDGDGEADAAEVGSNVNAPLDTDGDGTIDALESSIVDTDGDGVPNETDAANTNPCIPNSNHALCLALDSDGDGLTNAQEDALGTNRNIADTDGDGENDSLERGAGASALDTDGDGIIDALESSITDSDGDGVPNETDPANTNPCIPNSSHATCLATDSDGDGLTNAQEDALGTNRNIADTDGDGENDGAERGGATLPLDTDGDGAPDALESSIVDSDGDGIANETDSANSNPCIPNASSAACLAFDSDGDGLTNGQEATLGTNPNSTDSDGDGIADGAEVGGNVNTPTDSDGDGIINALESATVDTDGDGTPNSADADSDNDGIPDAVERGSGSTPLDTDGDGLANYLDRDSDNDTIPDALEAGNNLSSPVDTDGDGRPDYLDLDSDSDGLPDRLEGGGSGIDSDADGIDNSFDVNTQGGVDANQDGVSDGRAPPDTDGDGRADFRDTDSDGDGILDTAEANVSGIDTDGDGIDNTLDTDITHGVDANGDHIDDAYVLPNTDGDTVPDFRDLDTDNDGILDVAEAGLTDVNQDGLLDTGGVTTRTPRDTDGDLTADFRDLDSDNNGAFDIAGTANAARDANGDGRVDVITDTDGDGIANVVDASPNNYGSGVDTDGDGVVNAVDLDDDNDGIPDAQDGSGDADSDGIANYLDRDSDNDGLTDTIEAGGVDANHDGVIDGFVDSNGNGLADSVEVALGGRVLPLPDTDNDGNRDYVDIDSDADGLNDIIEANGVDTNSNGRVDSITDTDGDGLMDSVDGSVNGSVPLTPVDTDHDAQPDYIDVDSDNDGIPDSRESTADSDGDGIPDYRDPPGTLQTALRGAGAFNVWFVMMLAGLLIWRTQRVRHAAPSLLLVMLVASLPLRTAAAADHQGEWYIGGDVGLSWLKPRNVNGGYRIDDTTSSGYRLLAGKQVWEKFSVEGFYINSGKAGVSSDNANVGHLGEVKYTLYGVGTEWTPFKAGRTHTLYPLLKAGLVMTSNSTNSSSIRYDKLHTVGLYVGAAGVWQFANTWRAQAELSSYDQDELMLTIGVRKTFGRN
jgi:large repetitive protein